METNQEIESPEVFNKELLEAIAGAEDGHLKKASAAASKMVRRRIRENGFSRLVLPYKQISDSDLNYLPDTELPVIVEEMEPESPGAKSIAFNDSADTEFYRGDKFVVFFSKITTPEFQHNLPDMANQGVAFPLMAGRGSRQYGRAGTPLSARLLLRSA